MTKMLDELGDLGRAVTIMPSTFNASQIKGVIANLRFFIGARTHATIAGMSSTVPTISISYSIKARGINRDLFGDLPVVLDRSEEHTSELQSLMRISYAVFCLKKKQ